MQNNPGRVLILATKPFAKEITWKSWYYSLSTLTILIALFAGIYFLNNIFLRIACSIGAGLTMVRMFVIYHDHQHHTILHRSLPANILFKLYGIFILAPSSIWKRSHDYHHNHNCKLFSASIGSYPVMTKQRFLQSSKAEQRSYLAIRHPLTILFGYFTMFLYGMCVRSFICAPKRHWDSLIALILHIGISVSIFVCLGWLPWLLAAVIPFMLAFMIGAYLFYAQHNFPGVTFREKDEWCYEAAAMSSSSYMVMNPFWKWVTANIGYHHIHHINSRIPFYRLPEVMASIPQLREAKTTTLNPLDIMACLRLKVWDPNSNSMVGI
ncbi:MAG: fatty acid desaturase [Sphingobacteriales bacterium 50-39]|nr:fatty acid desaturase [Sphingobacteriales bacterium]OJW60721.1 MAG: fatty acid desaturase [Sphingobacteriales bacterium 50-39]